MRPCTAGVLVATQGCGWHGAGGGRAAVLLGQAVTMRLSFAQPLQPHSVSQVCSLCLPTHPPRLHPHPHPNYLHPHPTPPRAGSCRSRPRTTWAWRRSTCRRPRAACRTLPATRASWLRLAGWMARPLGACPPACVVAGLLAWGTLCVRLVCPTQALPSPCAFFVVAGAAAAPVRVQGRAAAGGGPGPA